jgi:PAS domain S-box-containing protein
MTDNRNTSKTKAQLIDEIEELQKKVRELEAQPDNISVHDSSTISDTIIRSLMHMGVWYLQIPSGQFTVSSEISHILGKTGKKGCQTYQDYLKTIHSGDRKALKDRVTQILEDQQPFTIVVRHRTSQNSSIQTVTQVNYFKVNQKCSILTGLVVDFTRFQKAAFNLEQENNRYRQLFELSPTGIILEDENGFIIDVNPSFCRSLGYTKDELVGQDVKILAHPDVQHQVSDNINQLMGGKLLKHNEKSIRKDGSICYMELSETRVRLPNGEDGILCIAEDYTEKLKALEEQVYKEKLQGVLEMAGAVCHELNQPLTTIFLTSDLMLDYPKKENLDKLTAVIKNEAIRISKITEKLMRITKYETRDYINGTKIFDIDAATESPPKE